MQSNQEISYSGVDEKLALKHFSTSILPRPKFPTKMKNKTLTLTTAHPKFFKEIGDFESEVSKSADLTPKLIKTPGFDLPGYEKTQMYSKLTYSMKTLRNQGSIKITTSRAFL